MSHAALADLLEYAWYALALVWLVTWFATKRTTRAEPNWVSFARSVMLGVIFVLLFDVPPQWAWLHRRIVPNTDALLLTGVVLTVLGVAFAIWARLALGTNWSSRATIKQGHELIIRGPYRMVRNPIYTGIFFALLGTALALGQVRHFLGLPILLLGWVWKITTEQRLLRAQFGESYERYCREVKAFIPYVI